MKRAFLFFILLWVMLPEGSILGQETRELTLPDNTTITLRNKQEVIVNLFNSRELSGELFLLDTSFFVHNHEYSAFTIPELTLIREYGITIDDSVYTPEDFWIIRDSIVVLTKNIYAFTEIKSIQVLRDPIKRKSAESRVSFSVSYCASLISPADEIAAQMNSNDLGDSKWANGTYREPNFPIGYTTGKYDEVTNYPKTTRTKSFFDIELEGYFSASHGVYANFSGIFNMTVEGFQELGQDENHIVNGAEYTHDYWNYGNYIAVAIKSKGISLAYSYSLANRRVSFLIGPALLPTEVAASTAEPYSKNLFGLIAGSSLKVVQKKSWFMGIKAYYRWFPNMEIGPYSVSGLGYDGQMHTSTFDALKIPMSSFTLGIGLGLRL